MRELFCVVDSWNNGITNWCGFEAANRVYVKLKDAGEDVRMLKKAKGQKPVEIPEY